MRVARSIIIIAALIALTAAPAVAQDFDPEATPPPDLFPRAKLAAFTSGWDDSAINRAVRDATTAANDQIEGRTRIRFGNTTSTSEIFRQTLEAGADGFDIVLISGGSAINTVSAAGRYPETRFVDIGAPAPCVTGDGRPDPSRTCAGGLAALPFNYMAVTFAESQGAYLAGIIAAAASRSDRLGIIGATPDCASCNRYIEGFELGARSIKPEISIEKAFLSDDDPDTGFGDADTAAAFTRTFVDVYQPDVLFPVAQGNNRTMLAAACEAGVRVVGAGIDVTNTQPAVAECVLTSIVTPIEEAAREAIFDISSARTVREKPYDLVNGGIVVTTEWQQVPGLPVDLPTRLEIAFDEIATGVAPVCIERCGPRQPRPSEEPVVVDGTDAGEDAGVGDDASAG